MSENRSVKVAGGLAGAAALAAGSGAYATVVAPATLPADIALPASGDTTFSPWDIDGDGNNDFLFRISNADGPFTGSDWAAAVFGYGTSAYAPYSNIGVNMVAGQAGPFAHYPFDLAAGVDVGSQAFTNGTGAFGLFVLGSRYLSTYYYGEFAQTAVTTGYLGLMFSNANGQHNAWIEVEVTRDGGMKFLSAGYNDAPKASGFGAIKTGEVPAPGTLAAMALGAVAFSRRSRRDN